MENRIVLESAGLGSLLAGLLEDELAEELRSANVELVREGLLERRALDQILSQLVVTVGGTVLAAYAVRTIDAIVSKCKERKSLSNLDIKVVYDGREKR